MKGVGLDYPDIMLPSRVVKFSETYPRTLTHEGDGDKGAFGYCVAINKTVQHSYVLVIFCLPEVKM